MKKREGLKIFSYGVLLLLILGSIIALCYFVQNRNQVLNPSEASGESFESGELNKGDEEREENMTPITSSRKKENGDVEVKLNNVKEGEIIVTTTKEKPSANDERWEEVKNDKKEYIIPANEVSSEEVYVWYKNGNNISLMSNSEIGTIAVDGEENYKLENSEKEFTIRIANYSDGTNTYETLKEAFEKAEDGRTITVLRDVEDNTPATLDASKTFTLDLNSKTINASGVTSDWNIGGRQFINNLGTLTVVDTGGQGKIERLDVKQHCATIATKGTLNLNAGTFNLTTSSDVADPSTIALDSGTMSVSGTATITAERTAVTRWITAIFTEKGNLNISGGTIKATGIENSTGTTYGVINRGDGNVAINMTGGTIETNGSGIMLTKMGERTNNGDSLKVSGTAKISGYYGINNTFATGGITITGGTITGSRTGIYQTATNDISISNATITGQWRGIYLPDKASGGTITINEGTVITGETNDGIRSDGNHNIVVNGGEITSNGTCAIYSGGAGNITINNGTLMGTLYGIKVENSSTNVTVKDGNIKGKLTGIILMDTATGNLTITGGQIIGETNEGVIVDSQSNVVIGTHGEGVSKENPVIQGGLSANNGFEFYDGILIDDTEPYVGNVIKKEEYYNIKTEERTIDGNVYSVAYLAKEITSATLLENDFRYDGTEKTPAVEVKWRDEVLTVDKDYTIQYSNNINAGTATVVVTGIGEYIGTFTLTFDIKIGSITGNVTIEGNAVVGETLTANVSNITPEDCQFIYKWYYNDTNSIENGTLIDGADFNTITVPEVAAGKYIYVVVTVTKDYYESIELKDITDIENNKTAVVGISRLMERMINEDTPYVIGMERLEGGNYTASSISKIIIETNIKISDISDIGIISWDVSMNNGDKTVMAWLIVDDTNSGMYELHIGGIGEKIYAPINAENLFAYYENCTSIDGIENIYTESTTNMRALFKKDSRISKLDLKGFNTTNVTDMGSMFEGCEALSELNVEEFDTSKVTAMDFMFADCLSLNLISVSGFKTKNVETMEAMFANCKNLKSIDLNFDTTNVKNIARMFMECSVLTELDLNSFNTINVTNMDSTFYNCKALTELSVGRFNTSNVENMHATFYGLESIEILEMSSFDTKKVKDMSFMFAGCKNITELNVGNFSTDNKVLVNIEGMFKDMEKVTAINLNNLDTSSVTKMNDLFNGCKALASVNVENFNTENVLDMSNMFANCTSLPKINVVGFKTSNVTDMSSMFENCSSLKILDLETFSTGHINDIKNMFSGDSELTSINLGSNFGRIDGTDMFKDCDSLEFIIARNIGSMTLSTDTGLSNGMVEIYVPGKNAEANYEKAENYNTVFGEDKIRSIIELIGEDFIEINKGDKYEDAGALVVGKKDEDKIRYSQYTYTYTVKGSEFNTNEVGEHIITYTLTDKFGQEVLSITRTVKVSNLLVVDTTEFSTSNAKWSGWKLFGNANIDNDGNLNLSSDGDYAEKWFIVGGTKWSMYITSLSTTDHTNKKFNIITEYYDKDFNPVEANNGKTTDTKTIDNKYNEETSISWDSDTEYGLNVEYVKVKIVWDKSVSESEIQIKEIYFGSGMNDTYSGMKVSAYSDDSELNEIRYLWTTESTGITEEQVTNVAKNNEIVYPKYGVKGTYYLWTYITNTKGLEALTCSEPVLIDNIEIEVDVPNIAFGKTSKVNAYIFDKYSQYVDDWSDYKKYTKNGTVTNESINADVKSGYFGSKAWNLNKSGTQEELHSNESIFNGLDEGSYLLVSANYRTKNSAGKMTFDEPKIYDSTRTKEYSSVIVAKYMDIYEDNNEHHIYYLMKLNESISNGAVVSGCLPVWGYSAEAGNMIIDGVQWFTFSDINNLDNEIAVKKYAEGEKDISYFRENGNVFAEDSFDANTNGIYTVYGRTSNGVERVRIIVIGSVDTTSPNIAVDLSGYIENDITSDDVSVVVTGTDDSAGVARIEYSFDQTEWTDIISRDNNNVLLNSDFANVKEVNYDWNTTENGNLMALHWEGFNPDVKSSNEGYHAHIDREIFKSNVFSIINKNSEFGVKGREIAAKAIIPKNTLKAGTSYILSFDMYAENVEVSVNNGLEYYSNGSNELKLYGTTVGEKVDDDEVGHWVRRSFTFTTPSDMDITKESILHIFGNLQAGSLSEKGEEGTFYIKNVKFEEGNKMTDWTPSVIEQTQNIKKGFVKFTSDMDENVYFKVTDGAGNETVISKHIIIDKTVPEITSVTINEGAGTTKNVEVIVHINKDSDDIKYMYISNENKEPSYYDWVDFKEYSKHYLVSGNGESKTVYVWIKDKAGNISKVGTDDIKLDASYTLKVTNNQTYSGSASYTVYYAIKPQSSGTYGEWQTNIDFKNLIPNTVYCVKTKIQDVNGLVIESEELTYTAEYDELNRLILKILN